MATTPLVWGRYAELRPEALAQIRRQTPVAYLPWGALAWHGPHLPLGLEGTIAETVAERVARRVGGALLPTTWWPAGLPDHPDTIATRGDAVVALWDDIFAGLAHSGWNVAVVISGAYHPGHDLALMAAAERAIEQHDLLALAVPPMALVDEEMLDHAALWETSLIMALKPDQVNLDALGVGPLSPAAGPIQGRDPRGTASSSIGNRALSLAVERLASAVSQLLTEGNAAPIHALYARRRERYQGLIERHGSNFAAATAEWWNALSSR